MIDPFFSSVAGAGIGAVGNVISAVQSNRNTKRYLAAQAEENEKAYQRNLEMWNKQNEYNTPTAVVQRLREAGLNPSLAYGTPNVSAPAPNAPIQDMSAIMNQRNVGASVAQSVSDAALKQAQIDLVRSEAEKNRGELGNLNADTQGKLTYNRFQEQILTGTIKEQNSLIELRASETDLNDMRNRETYTNIQNIAADTERIKADIDYLEGVTANVAEDTLIKRIEKLYTEGEYKARIASLYAQAKRDGAAANLTMEEFSQLQASAVYNLLTKKEVANNAMLEGVVLQYEGQQIKTSIDMDKQQLQFNKDNASINTIRNAIGIVGDCVGIVKDAAVGGYFGSRIGDRVETEATKTWNPATGRFDYSPVQKVHKKQYVR